MVAHHPLAPAVRIEFARRLRQFRTERGFAHAREFARVLGIEENRYTRYSVPRSSQPHAHSQDMPDTAGRAQRSLRLPENRRQTVLDISTARRATVHAVIHTATEFRWSEGHHALR